MGGARGQKERALSSACNSRQGLRFLHDREVCANQFFFYSYGGIFSKPCQRGGGETERQKSNFVALKIRTIERETETKIKDRNRDRKRQKEIDKENETKAEKRLPSLT